MKHGQYASILIQINYLCDRYKVQYIACAYITHYTREQIIHCIYLYRIHDCFDISANFSVNRGLKEWYDSCASLVTMNVLFSSQLIGSLLALILNNTILYCWKEDICYC